MATLGAQAAFLSAGGYHHHLGANSVESAGAGQAPPGERPPLTRATVVLSAGDDVGRSPRRCRRGPGARDGSTTARVLVRDPSGNPLG